MTEPPVVIVLAGVNGAGKTSSSRSLLAETLSVVPFVNADVIAQGIAGFDEESVAIQAGRIMLERLHALAEQRASFAFETTLAAKTYAPWLGKLRESGYHVRLFYFWLVNADLAVARVAERVRAGGHNIPEATIRRRYAVSLRNFFHLYRPVVSEWQVWNNSQPGLPLAVAYGDAEGSEFIFDPDAWRSMQREQAP